MNTTAPHHGTYHMMTKASTNSFCEYVSAQATIYLRAYVEVPTIDKDPTWQRKTFISALGTTGDSIFRLEYFWDGNSIQFDILYRDSGGWHYAGGFDSGWTDWNTYHCFEVEIVIDGTSGIYNYWVDGVDKGGVTGKDNNDWGNAKYYDFGNWWSDEPDALYFDCCVVDDEYIGVESEEAQEFSYPILDTGIITDLSNIGKEMQSFGTETLTSSDVSGLGLEMVASITDSGISSDLINMGLSAMFGLGETVITGDLSSLGIEIMGTFSYTITGILVISDLVTHSYETIITYTLEGLFGVAGMGFILALVALIIALSALLGRD